MMDCNAFMCSLDMISGPAIFSIHHNVLYDKLLIEMEDLEEGFVFILTGLHRQCHRQATYVDRQCHGWAAMSLALTWGH